MRLDLSDTSRVIQHNREKERSNTHILLSLNPTYISTSQQNSTGVDIQSRVSENSIIQNSKHSTIHMYTLPRIESEPTQTMIQ